jgi:hypothetical protein
MRRLLPAVAVFVAFVAAPAANAGLPLPHGSSSNVDLLMNIPGSYAGLTFSDDGRHAYATGWATGLTVFDLSDPALPLPVGALPLPHFENEDVDVCGDTLLIANDRVSGDTGGMLHVVDVAEPSLPSLLATLQLPGDGRGAGHVANFVNQGCTQVWVDGGDDVEVIDLSDRAEPRSLGTFRSWAAVGPNPERPSAFLVTHDSELDEKGIVWQTGGGGIAGYRIARDPLKPRLVASSGMEGVNIDFDGATSPYNDYIMHNSERMGRTLLVTEEDYIDTSEDQPGGCNGQGKFETWRITGGPGKMTPIDTWMTELNAVDSKAPATVNCSSHWFEERDGIAAVAWYEQGVRLLDVRDPADIRQVGYYLPSDGVTWAAYWAPGADDIVYATDPARGIDVLKVLDLSSAAQTVTAPVLPEWFAGELPYAPSTDFGWSCAIRTR